jgi:hypothetical protein
MQTNPFPGMNPYLEDESLWPEFHHQMMCLHQNLLPGLVDRYRAAIVPRCYPLPMPGGPQERQEGYIEIRQRTDGRVVTLIDLVSPSNKLNKQGRSAYLDQRREGRSANANLVEIDLVLQGQPTLEYSRDGLPDWDYAVTVTRSTQPERFEIYTATLQKRLPRLRLPLASDDRDSVIDLHMVFTRCCEEGGFSSRIDYERDPVVPLDEEDRRWLDALLINQGLRLSPVLREQVAVAAYYLWQSEGCVHGRDKEHWSTAVALVRTK